MGYLQLLNAIEAQPTTKSQGVKGLMYMDVGINGKTSYALVDTEASHNFISKEEAKRVGLKVFQGDGSIKAVNTTTKPVEGVAQGVKLQLGGWSGVMDFTIVMMDDHTIDLGMEFMDKVKAFPIPGFNVMCIVEGESACMIPLKREAKTECKTLSAIQLSAHWQGKRELNHASPKKTTQKRRKKWTDRKSTRLNSSH